MTLVALSLVLAGTVQWGSQGSPREGPAEGIAAALDAVSERHVAADLAFLTDDALAGRDTPGAGLDAAARYLAARLARLGLEPGGTGEDPWLVPFALTWWRLDPARCSAELTAGGETLALAFGEDYHPERLAHLGDWDLSGELVSVGGGSEAELADLELEGCWALLLDLGGSLRPIAHRVAEAGALGMVATPSSDYREFPYDERFAAVSQAMLRGIASGGEEPERRSPDLPVVMLPARSGVRVLMASGAEWEGVDPPAGTRLGVTFRERRATADPRARAANVCALLPGGDPELAREVIVLLAHYDGLGEANGQVFPGADDNASGTAGLVAVAEALAAGPTPRRTVALAFLAGGAKGFWGADAWVAAPPLPEKSEVVCAVHLDAIGRPESPFLAATPSPGHASHHALARAAAWAVRAEGFPPLASLDGRWGRSDHVVFARELGVPALCLSTGDQPEHRTPMDLFDTVDPGRVAQVARVAVRLVHDLQGDVLGAVRGPSVADGGSAVERAAAEELGWALAAAAERGDADFLRAAADPRAVVARAKIPGLEQDEVLRRWLTPRAGLDGVWWRVLGIVADGGAYAPLRVEEDDRGDPVLWMRLALGTRFDYHALRIAADPRGHVRIVDAWTLSHDEWLGEQLARHAALARAGAEQRAAVAAGAAPPALAPLDGLEAALDAGDSSEGLALLARVPEDARGGRDYARLRLAFAGAPGDGASGDGASGDGASGDGASGDGASGDGASGEGGWPAARADFEARFPGSSGVVDWAVARRGAEADAAEHAAALARIEERTADPVFGDLLRGLRAWHAGDPAAARPFLERATARDPGFEEPWWRLLSVLEELGEFRAYGEALDGLLAAHPAAVTVADVERAPLFAAFRASDAYGDWRERR